jgi:hypothetical protein
MNFTHTKMGRNSLCFCGSGKKYKKCCFQQNENPADDKESMLIKKKQHALWQKFVDQHPDQKVHYWQQGSMDEGMSGAILDYADDFLRFAKTCEDYTWIISLSILAWNLSIINSFADPQTFNNVIDDMLADSLELEEGSEGWREVKGMLIKLIHKKQRNFPYVNRIVYDFEVIPLKEGEFYLNVLSSPEIQE